MQNQSRPAGLPVFAATNPMPRANPAARLIEQVVFLFLPFALPMLSFVPRTISPHCSNLPQAVHFSYMFAEVSLSSDLTSTTNSPDYISNQKILKTVG
jgi:hypothetical protein